MSSGPTRGASDGRAWSASPGKALAVRVLAFAIPILASYLVASVAGPGLWRPAGWFGLVVFIVQMGIVGSAAALLAERQVRRLLPLAALLNMTLVFPDQAPSRFRIALRSGTIKRLVAKSEGTLSDDHQQAAEQLVAMVVTLGRHERLTRGHTERVRAYATLIGQEMGLTAEEQQLLSWGAMSHDVGKLTVPAEILSSPDKPTEAEWDILRGHPAAGAEMLEPLADWLGEWRLAAGQHHERWDGGGYPNGLAGADISLAGRIVAVADAFDVITANRSYKKALSAEAAREEMVNCAGGQFDPAVVRALLEASLGKGRARLGFLGGLTELGSLSSIPRGAAQVVAAGATTVSVVAAAATGGALTQRNNADEEAAFPMTVIETAPPTGLPFEAPASTVPTPPGQTVDSLAGTNTETAELPGQSETTSPQVTSAEAGPGSTTANGSTSTIQNLGPNATTNATYGTSTTASSATTSAGTASTATTVATTTWGATTTAPGTSTTTKASTTQAPGATTTTTSPATTTSATTTTTTAPTTTTTIATTTTTVPGITWGLGNALASSSSDSTSQDMLPMWPHFWSGPLKNYDTDRDSEPGLVIQRGIDLTETDSTKMQRWQGTVNGSLMFGTVQIRIWAAVKDFDTSKGGTVLAGLYDCDTAGDDCTLLISGSETFNQASFGSGFGEVTFDLGYFHRVFGAGGRTLVVKVVAGSGSDDDLWFAYATETYPSKLIIAY